jgi:hypothetical protein
MAVEADADGNETVNTPEAILSAPKFSTATAAPVVLLYINAPLVIKLAEVHTESTNEINAVSPLLAGGTTTNTLPPAVYPVPTTSSVAE